ncbi:FAD-binding domain-containing protein [Periconia macrospinosa]|uniref:FAD-binding domain-containing protein n=1 Tax=Periconia macrospinosa TaxID=97972 RepID=A0A2V1DDB1_9PLEO|nr:FAD-binding domain-containing protein [Periconia macrospinosa]
MATEKLQAALPDKVFLENTKEYDSFSQSYWYRSSRQKPLCVVSPTSATDVSTAVKILAETAGVRFAIWSGGHSPHPNISNTDEGVTIDLRGLNSITKSAEKEHVVYKVLGKENRTAVGSRGAGVGVGGFLLGGGLSHFAPELGFACDQIVNMEVVLASGDVIEVYQSNHADFFCVWKGTGSKFGVVTRIDIATIPHHSIWGGSIMYPYDTKDANLNAFLDLKKAHCYEPLAQIELSFLYAPQMGGHFIANSHWYSRPIEYPELFQRFDKISPQLNSTMRLDTIQAFKMELATFATTTFQINPTILPRITSLWEETSKTLSMAKNIVSVVTYQPCSPLPKNSSNAMGFPANSTPHEDLIILALTIFWENVEDSNSVNEETEALIERIEEIAKEEGVYHPFQYVNYAAPWQNPIKSYGEESNLAIRKVSKKYDPKGFFEAHCEGFKL